MPTPPPTPRPPYVYRCVDRSILVDRFRLRWVPLFDGWVPRWMPANYITLGASALMWIALACIVHARDFAPATLALLLAGLLHFYLVYDHVDGMQAKKTRSSSALGEYLDHSLDVYHGTIAVLAVFALIGLESRMLVLAMLGCTHLAFAATMMEEKERGELFFGKLGSLEGVLLFIAFFFSWLFPSVRAWWLAPLVGRFPAYYLLVVGGGIGAVAGTIDCLRRIGRVPLNFALFALGHVALVIAFSGASFPFWTAVAVLMLHAGDYSGRAIGSHLLAMPHPRPDVIAPIAAVAGASVGWLDVSWFACLLFAWLGLKTAWGIWRVVRPLRADWRWCLPGENES